MKINLKRDRLAGILLVAMMLVGMNVSAQRIRVQGHVTNPQGKSVPNVNVLNPVNDERIEMSDEDGRYSVLVEKNGSLKFTCVGYEDKTVKVAGKQILNVVLKDAVIELDEVTITSKVKDKVIPEPTDIEIKGNYFHLKTRVPVPKEMFNSHRRLVLQPSIYDVTLKKRLLMRPVVFDGDTYNTTQNRMYDYDMDKDPLHDYIRVKTTSSRKGDIIAYHDSIYIEYLQHDYRADVHLAMENYRNIIYPDSFCAFSWVFCDCSAAAVTCSCVPSEANPTTSGVPVTNNAATNNIVTSCFHRFWLSFTFFIMFSPLSLRSFYVLNCCPQLPLLSNLN